jgi:hypothetical protein
MLHTSSHVAQSLTLAVVLLNETEKELGKVIR